ncbi:MAG: hypothetical protein QW711_07815 [Candidatus Korarchaeum sp.]
MVACREALNSDYNLAIIEELLRRGKVKRYWREGGLIIYEISDDLTFDDIVEAVRTVKPWSSKLTDMDARIFWSTSVLMGRYPCPAD